MRRVNQRFGVILLSLLAGACSSSGWLGGPNQDVRLYQCQWGAARVDLCRYDSDEARIAVLLDVMTLDEKIGQMTQSVWHNNVTPEVIRDRGIGSIIHTDGPVPGPAPGDWMDTFDGFQRAALQSRLGVPLLIGVDAVHGQNTFDGAVIFPHNIGMAASRNLTLIEQAARITAREAVGTGFNWTFSPCIAMPQHEHWGRVYEGFSEDRDFTIAAARASIRGHQGADLGLDHTIAATAKHFIGDGHTSGGVEGGDAQLAQAYLREQLLPPYAAAVHAGVASVMVGFNSVNGTPMHQHRELVSNVLKGELGFAGVVLTDWDGGIRFGPPHKVINAGIDMAMQPGNHDRFIAELKASVLDGTVPEARIDDAVERILRLKFALGLFEQPFAKRDFATAVGAPAHRRVARQAVRESLVLLKNEDDALPLRPGQRLAVVGEHADSTGLQSGGWTVRWQGMRDSYRGGTTLLQGIREVADFVEYRAEGCHPTMTADTVIAVVGEGPYAEGEGDTDQLTLSPPHAAMIRDCRALGKRVITVLISGRPLLINEPLAASDAFVAAWLPGSEGAGVADFLFAADGFTPVGTLPHAWPKALADIPLGADDPRALFPLGYGLRRW